MAEMEGFARVRAGHGGCDMPPAYRQEPPFKSLHREKQPRKSGIVFLAGMETEITSALDGVFSGILDTQEKSELFCELLGKKKRPGFGLKLGFFMAEMEGFEPSRHFRALLP